ncbi:MAG: 1,4-dihydroxy-2-naphthoate octaprenyltransferase [Bacteroidales bacterium]
MIKSWISAARPRTLPTSLSPVIIASGYAFNDGKLNIPIVVVCALFAIVAQIASNFANDYFDFKNGSDKASRIGPRRAVASGEIAPERMLKATIVMLAIAALLGSFLIPLGGWALVILGVIIIAFALLYSAGPYPLSYHGLGEITVFIFFGIIPVCATYWLQTGIMQYEDIIYGGTAAGLLSVNILLVNNYRDRDTDTADGKRTAVVIMGKRFALYAYLINGILASLLFLGYNAGIIAAAVFIIIHIFTWNGIRKSSGSKLNQYIGRTAANQLIFTLIFIALILIYKTLL